MEEDANTQGIADEGPEIPDVRASVVTQQQDTSLQVSGPPYDLWPLKQYVNCFGEVSEEQVRSFDLWPLKQYVACFGEASKDQVRSFGLFVFMVQVL